MPGGEIQCLVANSKLKLIMQTQYSKKKYIAKFLALLPRAFADSPNVFDALSLLKMGIKRWGRGRRHQVSYYYYYF